MFNDRFAPISKAILICMSCCASIFAAAQPPGAYVKAQEHDRKGNYDAAIAAYQGLFNQNPQSEFGRESLYQMALIYDQKLHDPAKAFAAYENYARLYSDRNAERAKVRAADLARYKDTDIAVYRRYNEIISMPRTADRREKLTSEMEKFLAENPKVAFRTEALLWLANNYMGSHRNPPTTEQGLKWLEKAIEHFSEVVEISPKGDKNRLAALKNLGDCYRIKKDYARADAYYRQTVDEGGHYGEILVKEFTTMNRMAAIRDKAMLAMLILVPLSIAVLVFILPFQEFSKEGLMRGLRRASIVLVLGVVATLLAKFLPEEDDDFPNRYPQILLIVTGITVLWIVFNSVALKAREQVNFRLGLYRAAMAVAFVGLNFVVLYKMRLLPYVEHLIFRT